MASEHKKAVGDNPSGPGDADLYAPPKSASGGPVYLPTTPFQEAYPINKVSAWLLILVVVIPAMMLSGFLGDWNTLSVGAWIAIATLGAAAAGAGFVHRRAPHWVGAFGGAVAAPGALAAITWWVGGRSSVFRLEIVAAFFVGAAPGFIVYYLLFQRSLKASAPARGESLD